jgi:hypothetical protein
MSETWLLFCDSFAAVHKHLYARILALIFDLDYTLLRTIGWFHIYKQF